MVWFGMCPADLASNSESADYKLALVAGRSGHNQLIKSNMDGSQIKICGLCSL